MLFVSLLSILMVGWKNKLNAEGPFIQYAFAVVMDLFAYVLSALMPWKWWIV